MVFRIRYAGGLTDELLRTVESDRLSISSARNIRRSSNSIYITVEFDLLVDGKEIGAVELTTYMSRSVQRVHRMEYEGIVPGYVTVNGKTGIVLVAKETVSPDERDLPFLDISRPNNTKENPLYRHDEHKVRFADFERKVNRDGSLSDILLPRLASQ